MEEGSAIKDCTTSYRGGAIAMIYEPYSSYSSGTITFTMKGAAISGCATTGTNTYYTQGGAIYAESYDKYSGDVTLNLSDTIITDNTSEALGGGVYSDVANHYANRTWVYDLFGKMNITGNKVGEAANNLYLANGSKLPSVTSLAADSTIGVSTSKETLQDDGTIVPVYISSDADNTGYFTSDKDYEVKLDEEQNQLYIIAESGTVTVTLGGNCKTSLVYKQNGQVVENPTDPGTYQVYLVISGDGNFLATYGLTADTFTITHPADHQWGEWEHNDTQHYRTCQVPGYDAEERADHETTIPATCIPGGGDFITNF